MNDNVKRNVKSTCGFVKRNQMLWLMSFIIQWHQTVNDNLELKEKFEKKSFYNLKIEFRLRVHIEDSN